MNTNLLKLTLLLASSLTIMSGATISPSLPQMAKVFVEVPNAVFLSKLVLTLPALFIAIWAPIAGKIIDKTGRLKLFYISLILYAIGGCSGFFLDNLYLILAGRAILGIAVGGIMTITITLIGDYFENEERTKFLGYQAAFVGMGGIIFITAGGILADMNWRYPFLIYVLSLIPLILAAIYMYEPEREKNEYSNAISISALPKITLLIFISAFVGMLFFYLVPVQIPFLLEELGITSNKLSGYAIACTTVSGLIFSLLYSRIKAKFSYKPIVALIFLCFGIGYSLIYVANTYVLVLTVTFLVGIGSGLLNPGINSWVLEVVSPQQRGLATGLLTTSLFIGQFLSPIAISPLIYWVGLQAAFLIIGITGLLLAVIYLLIGLKDRNKNKQLSKA